MVHDFHGGKSKQHGTGLAPDSIVICWKNEKGCGPKGEMGAGRGSLTSLWGASPRLKNCNPLQGEGSDLIISLEELAAPTPSTVSQASACLSGDSTHPQDSRQGCEHGWWLCEGALRATA